MATTSVDNGNISQTAETPKDQNKKDLPGSERMDPLNNGTTLEPKKSVGSRPGDETANKMKQLGRNATQPSVLNSTVKRMSQENIRRAYTGNQEDLRQYLEQLGEENDDKDDGDDDDYDYDYDYDYDNDDDHTRGGGLLIFKKSQKKKKKYFQQMLSKSVAAATKDAKGDNANGNVAPNKSTSVAGTTQKIALSQEALEEMIEAINNQEEWACVHFLHTHSQQQPLAAVLYIFYKCWTYIIIGYVYLLFVYLLVRILF
ncbi:hypothetical protein RFI_07081 [Reticulomyxa filosa]|uniref:Uncharacterized protein n=1 Tax=Reticulomyxa filosa TaxID=46433 RepID=X6NVJ5_RETFI|nr:hypothetical protein RFI_07081 [Reticulomyxa filosa]|eukprot:ETO30031.1 hypothetical protein RFI_07081 [Reticulomyxa filosa]